MTFGKRTVCAIIAGLMILSSLPLLALQSSAEQVYVVNGEEVRAGDGASSASDCWAYANAIYEQIWGVRFSSSFSSNDNFLRDMRDEDLTLTADHLKEYVSAAALGAVLRVCNAANLHASDSAIEGDKPGHSQVIVQKDSEGFTVLQGGLSQAPYYKETYYTWQSFLETSWLGGSYAYIKYLKWPGAASYAEIRAAIANAPVVTGAVYPSGTLMRGSKFYLEGVIYSKNIMTNVTGRVTDTLGREVVVYEKHLSSQTYDISSEGMDNAIGFGKLPQGGYNFEVIVTDVLGVEYTVLQSFFTVAASKVVNEEKIYNFLINNGFGKAAACGVLANIEHESYFNPLSLYYEVGDYYSHGLIQWNHGRYDRLLVFCQENGYDAESIEGQLRYMMHELSTVYYYQDTWIAVNTAPETEQGAYDVGYIWCFNYEIPSDTERRSVARGNLAKEYFARYTAADHVTIGFNSRGGSEVAPVSVSYAGVYGDLPVPTRDGCTFVGWYTLPDGGTKVNPTDTVWVTDTQTLYAHWTPNQYTIRYIIDNNRTAATTYMYGDTKTLMTNVTKENDVFGGWYESPDYSGKPVTAITPTDFGDKTYYAKWNLYTGFRSDEDGIRYIENGEVAVGYRTIQGNTLYFLDRKMGLMVDTETAVIGGKTVQFEPLLYKGLTIYRLVTDKNGLVAENNGVRYYLNNVAQTGWVTIGIDRLFFDTESGLMAQRQVTVSGKTYALEKFEKDDFTLWREVKNGLYAEDGGVRYYVDGRYQVGWQTFDFKNVYFDVSTGLMVTTTTVINNITHPFEPFEYEGFTLYRSVYKKNGFFEDGSYIRYYIDDAYVTGFLTIDGNKMYFDRDSGNMLKYSRKISGVWYDIEPFTYNRMTLYRVAQNGFFAGEGGIRCYRDGNLLTGWQEVDGNTYYFDASTGLMADGSAAIGGKYYAFEPITRNGLTLYRKIELRNGLFEDADGVRLYKDGKHLTGWQEVGGYSFYFYVQTGLMYTDAATTTIGGKRYVFTAMTYQGMTVYRCDGLRNGLYEEEDGIRLYSEGAALYGWQTVDGYTMYFNGTTKLMNTQNELQVQNKTYHFECETYHGLTLYYRYSGILRFDQGIRYYRDGIFLTGWQDFEGYTYYFRPDGGWMICEDVAMIDGVDRYFTPVRYGNMFLYRLKTTKNGLYQDEDGIRFYREDRYLTGWQTVGGKSLYFLPDSGLMATSSTKIDGVLYEFEPYSYQGMQLYVSAGTRNGFYVDADGVRYYDGGRYLTGWQELVNSFLYFDPTTGVMVAQDTAVIGSKTYRFENFLYGGITLYRRLTGIIAEDGGVRYYADGLRQTGFKAVDGSEYYFDPTTGLMNMSAEAEIGGKVYRFETFVYNGLTLYRLKTGFVLSDEGVRYYKSGRYLTGWQTLGGDSFYFSTQTGFMCDGSTKIAGKYYSFEEVTRDGVTVYRSLGVRNGFFGDPDGVRYYEDGVYLTDWQEDIGGDTFYFSKTTGLMVDGSTKIGGIYYVFEEMQHGALTLYRLAGKRSGLYEDEDGVRCYAEGVYLTGWQDVAGDTYYFSKTTGLMVDGTGTISGLYYVFEQTQRNGLTVYRCIGLYEGLRLTDEGVKCCVAGQFATGWQIVDGDTFYFDPDTGVMADGSSPIDGKIYIFEQTVRNGMTVYRCLGVQSGFFAESRGVLYYQNGAYVTGWQEISGETFYFDPATGLMANGSAAIDGKMYDFKEVVREGITVYKCLGTRSGLYPESGGIRYYLEGVYQKGWKQIDGETFYFGMTNGLMSRGLNTIGGKYYVFEEMPYGSLTVYRCVGLREGFLEKNGSVYLCEAGVPAKGWRDVNGYRMYFSTDDGRMIDVETATIDGTEYEFTTFVYEGLVLYRLKTEYSVEDVSQLLDVIAASTQLLSSPGLMHDFNGDGALDVSDVTALLDLIAQN